MCYENSAVHGTKLAAYFDFDSRMQQEDQERFCMRMLLWASIRARGKRQKGILSEKSQTETSMFLNKLMT
jgi:hypothetical protein